jgi:hypothetical protein
MSTNGNHFILFSDNIKQKNAAVVEHYVVTITNLRLKLCQSEYENPIIGICSSRLPEYGRN